MLFVPKKVELLKISLLKICSYFKNRYHHAKIVEKKRITFSVSPYFTPLFPRKGNIEFSEVALVAAHCSCLISCIMIALWNPWNPVNTAANIYLFVENSNSNTETKWRVCLNLLTNKLMDCRLARVFLKNLINKL